MSSRRKTARIVGKVSGVDKLDTACFTRLVLNWR